MIRKFALTASAVALAAAGLGLAGAGSASAGLVITAGPGSSLNCSLAAAVKLKPALKDNWIQAQHSSDSNSDVVAIPDTTYAPPAPETVTAKGTATSCTGTVTDGTHTTAITKIAVVLTSDPAHPTTDPGTCVGLFNPPAGPPSTARYTATLKYTGATAKVTPSTITDVSITPGSFSTTGGTITGSFAGGSSTATGNPDAATAGIALQEGAITHNPPVVATSSSPSAPNVCQSALKIKTGTKHSATPKAPKGFKALQINNDLGPSTFAISR